MRTYILSTLFLMVLLYSCNNYAMLIFEETMVVISTDRIERFLAHTVADEQPYVNGGLFFTYPTGLFTTQPIVTATIVAAVHATDITYTVEICSETASFAEVMVFKNSSGTITEAANGEVNVSLKAIGT